MTAVDHMQHKIRTIMRSPSNKTKLRS